MGYTGSELFSSFIVSLMRIARHLHLKGHEGTSMEDLPEDIILSLVSKLTLRDAVNFSIVCNQWAHVPSCLDTILLGSDMAKSGIQLCPGGKDAFVKGVNQFLQHYNKLRNMAELPISLRYFFIFFCLDRASTADIDTWISMAIHNGVKILIVQLECELHLDSKPRRPHDEQYMFPWQLLNQSPAVLKGLYLRSCFFGCRLTSKLTSLENLVVCDTLVTQYDIDIILECCPNLQTIVLSICRVPAKLTFAGGSFTSLRVLYCHPLEEIEVLSGRALTEFTYKGGCVGFNLINAPKLTNLIFNMADADGVDYVFQNLRRDFPAMTSLSIYRTCETLPSMSHLHGGMSSFLQLQELKLYIYPACSFSLGTMKEMLKACPILTRLEMVPPCSLDAENESTPVQYRHKCLRFIKISGLCGGRGSVELAKFLVQVSEAVQHVIIKQKLEVDGFFRPKHSASWHDDPEPKEAVKHILVKLMTRGHLTFL